jgi:phage gpG-like protein
VSGRLKNSMTQSIEGRTLTIGTNLIYARIQQQGGVAGRGHKAKIPARPYLVFRPEDPQAIATKIETYLEGAVVEGTA